MDFRVDDVARAVTETDAIGGAVVKPRGTYVEWAVMNDPFGNELCVIRWPRE